MMTFIGYTLFILGFIAGSYIAVLKETEVDWIRFSVCIIAGAVGVVLIRLGHHKKHRNQNAIEENIQSVFDALKRINENIHALVRQAKDMSPYDVRHKVDDLFEQDLDIFVQARESISHVYGLQAYADVMSFFASGERYLNRAWSASADGYVDEVQKSLESANALFTDAFEKLKQCTNHTST